MMKSLFKKLWYQAPLAILATLFLVASMKAYVRIQTTLIGYRIGQFKQMESELLETQSTLKMELAKISTKQNLLQTSGKGAQPNSEGWAVH
ncbi:MAG: hypothetical protein H7318_02130 [Oligoflexus sp.]|nr:hypothetical protein [Oligoflexus sp.]